MRMSMVAACKLMCNILRCASVEFRRRINNACCYLRCYDQWTYLIETRISLKSGTGFRRCWLTLIGCVAVRWDALDSIRDVDSLCVYKIRDNN